jgi:hypothetical protein
MKTVHTKQSASTKSTEISMLRDEVAILRSFVIGAAGRDAEGNYQPQFVRRIQKAAQETPVTSFKNANQFLKLVSEEN